MKKDKRINIVTDEVTKFLLEGRASVKGMSLSELLIEGGLLYGGFDQGFIEKFEKMSGEMGIKATILLQNFVINQVALTAQFEAVFGRSSKSLDRAFRWKDGKMMTGDELLEKLNKEYKEVFQEWKEKLIDCHEKGGDFRVSDESVEILGGQVWA
ncbi:MAG: hypothetical protein H8D67_05720 [Deltaproteobacteria bacterium]|nr:hypothetical protein [Deltaproteobacteria bacterium]MBL7176537.1 hypothetical protein [Desulfobacteraceae bacterium]